jgi:hypothetical protein
MGAVAHTGGMKDTAGNICYCNFDWPMVGVLLVQVQHELPFGSTEEIGP